MLPNVDSRSIYIYTKNEDVLKNTLERILSRYKKIHFSINFEVDSEWSFYNNQLYPDIYENQWILDRNVIEQLKKHNDLLYIPREVNHWIYFSDKESREAFKKAIIQKEYSILDERILDEETEFPYQLSISHSSPVDLDSIYIITTDLLRRALEVGGDYDGWETAIVKN